MPANEYYFVSHWRVPCTPQEAYDIIQRHRRAASLVAVGVHCFGTAHVPGRHRGCGSDHQGLDAVPAALDGA